MNFGFETPAGALIATKLLEPPQARLASEEISTSDELEEFGSRSF